MRATENIQLDCIHIKSSNGLFFACTCKQSGREGTLSLFNRCYFCDEYTHELLPPEEIPFWDDNGNERILEEMRHIDPQLVIDTLLKRINHNENSK